MVSGRDERAVQRGDGAAIAQPTLAGAGRDKLARTKSPSYALRAWRRFKRNRLSLVSMVIFLIMILFSYGAPLISKYVTKTGFGDQNLQATFAPAGKTISAIQIGGPNSGKTVTTKYILGADELGRDVLTRLAYGGRISLTVSFLTLAIALTVGLLIGALAGYYGGWVDTILMRLVDVFISIPGLFVLILVSTTINNNKLITGTSFYRTSGWLVLPFVIAILSWTGISRLIRGEFLSLKSRDYVEAARVLGSTDGRIIVRHILPNVVPIIIVWATLAIPGLILTEAALSYLSFGVQIPTPSWGNMLTNSTQYFSRSPGLVVLPGALIFITTMAVNLMGNGLRDALDPRLND
ncbi:MAG TPA: ABC transporter permease [Thermomicrobiales bacterium]